MYGQMRLSFDKINVQSMMVEDNDGDHASIFQKYQNLKKKFVQIHGYITLLCNFAEKTKNLFTWKDPLLTTYLMTALFLLGIVVHSLPTRLFLLIVSTKNNLLNFAFLFLIYSRLSQVVLIYLDGKKALAVRRTFNK